MMLYKLLSIQQKQNKKMVNSFDIGSKNKFLYGILVPIVILAFVGLGLSIYCFTLNKTITTTLIQNPTNTENIIVQNAADISGNVTVGGTSSVTQQLSVSENIATNKVALTNLLTLSNGTNMTLNQSNIINNMGQTLELDSNTSFDLNLTNPAPANTMLVDVKSLGSSFFDITTNTVSTGQSSMYEYNAGTTDTASFANLQSTDRSYLVELYASGSSTFSDSDTPVFMYLVSYADDDSNMPAYPNESCVLLAKSEQIIFDDISAFPIIFRANYSGRFPVISPNGTNCSRIGFQFAYASTTLPASDATWSVTDWKLRIRQL